MKQTEQTEIEVFEIKYAVMSASITGFYKSLGTKVNLCKHVSCGYKKPPITRCTAHPDDKDNPWEAGYWANEKKKHRDKGCTNDWCVINHGKKREVEDPKIKCERSYYHLYTNEELADPATKVEFIALEMRIAGQWSHYVISAIYDLLADKWANDDWWSTTPKGDLMPCNQTPPDVPPSQVYGIEKVVTLAKASL